MSLLVAVRKVVLGLAVVGLLGGAAWGVWHWRAASEGRVRFRTEKVARGRVAALINASGTVVPEEVIDVGAQVAGRILEFGRDLDDSRRTIDYRSRVEEGTVLARIDDSLIAPEVGIARAELAVAEAEVARCHADLDAAKTRMQQTGRDLQRARRSGTSVAPLEMDAVVAASETARVAVPAAEAALEKAKKTVLRAQETLKKAETNLGYCTIKSPVKGVIIDRRVNIGQTVVASLNAPSLFLIARDLRRMQVWASVSEADIGRIHAGLPAAFKVDAFPDEVFAGIVTQIRLNASMTQNVVTYTVVVSTDNESLKLLPYLTANLQFRVAHRDDVLLVPNSALRYRPSPARV
ncbi:MAG: efflux RND transporter periplasmic adaptor subunit, partial [Gemmataceae bacterium]